LRRFGSDLEPEIRRVEADTLIKGQEANPGDERARHHKGREVESVECPHRLARKGLSRALGDLAMDGKNRPVLGGEAKLRPQVRGPRFGKNRIMRGSNQRPFAFDQGKLRSDDELRAGESCVRDIPSALPEQPCQDRARLRVEIQRSPLS